MTKTSKDTKLAAATRLLRCFMNLQALQSMTQLGSDPLQAVRYAGYDGIQFVQPLDRPLRNEALALGLAVCGSSRVNTPDEAAPLAKEAREEGLECLTLHVGWGTESDDEAAALVSAVLDASVKYSIPLYPETHRATIFQDPWRAVHLLARFPNLELNGDFSHWYTGSEMVYGGFENNLKFIRPVLNRIAFLHGRIGNPGCMQVDIGDGSAEERPYVRHFRALWTESFRGFLHRRSSADSFCFTPELLGPEIYYARVFDGREESDRWQQSWCWCVLHESASKKQQGSAPARTAATPRHWNRRCRWLDSIGAGLHGICNYALIYLASGFELHGPAPEGGSIVSFSSFRRDFLRTGGLGLAGISLPSFALAASEPHGPTPHQPVFNVRSYGAKGDGKTVDTAAVNRAIEAAVAKKGGIIFFPMGTYLCFSIHLKSYVHLYLDQGAIILAADSPPPGQQTGYNGGTYDQAEPNTPWESYQDFGHNHWHNSLMWGEDIHNFSITGPGLIWGKGLSRGNLTSAIGPVFIAEQPGVGNKSIALKNCRNVLLRDFSILKGGHFGLLLTGVDNVTIDNLRIDTDHDGMNIDCCRNVRVSNCTVNSPWDDGICLKSSFALGYARPTRNVTIASCCVSGWYELGTILDGTFKKFDPKIRPYGTGRIKCGTESNGGFINVTITNCIFEGCTGYALESVDGALVEDVVITNTTMRDLGTGPIFLRLGARLRGPKDSTKVGTMKRILIDNLVCHNAPQSICSILSGIPTAPIEDVKLSNIYIETVGGGTAAEAQNQPPEDIKKYPEPNMFGPMPASGFFLRHINNLEMSHVEIANTVPDARPAFSLNAVNRADFFAITAQRGENGAFALHSVKDLRIGWSRAAADVALASADDKMV